HRRGKPRAAEWLWRGTCVRRALDAERNLASELGYGCGRDAERLVAGGRIHDRGVESAFEDRGEHRRDCEAIESRGDRVSGVPHLRSGDLPEQADVFRRRSEYE